MLRLQSEPGHRVEYTDSQNESFSLVYLFAAAEEETSQDGRGKYV